MLGFCKTSNGNLYKQSIWNTGFSFKRLLTEVIVGGNESNLVIIATSNNKQFKIYSNPGHMCPEMGLVKN